MDYLFAHRGVDKRCHKGVEGVVAYDKEQIMSLLRSCDANHDGRLSEQELKRLFNELGSRFASWRVSRALHHADGDGDGYISEDEFPELVKYILKCDYRIK